MNNKFKRALSSILAFVMLCSCVCVMNVSSVFADETTITYDVGSYATSNDLKPVAANTATSDAPNKTSGTVMFETDGNYKVTLKDKYYFYTANSNISGYTTALVSANGGSTDCFTVDLNAGDKIEVYYSGSDSKYNSAKAISVTFKSTNDTGATGSCTAAFALNTLTHTATETETYTLTNTTSKNRFVLYGIKITPQNDGDESGDNSGDDNNADDTTSKVIPIGTDLNYSLGATTNTTYNDTALPSASEANLTTYDSADGYVKIAGSLSCNVADSNPHALLFNTDGTIKFNVEGKSTINIGLCKYNKTKNQIITVATTADGATVSPESFSNDGDSDAATTTVYYNGGEGDVTFNIPAGTYIHSLAINVTGVDFTAYQGGDITVDATVVDDPANNKFSSVTNAIKAISTYYGTECADGVTVTIADGTYRGRFDVTTSNVTLNSASKDATKVIIVDNANEANQYVDKTFSDTFHGDTIAVKADGFKAENITIMNDAELDTNLGSTNTAAGYYTDSDKTGYSYTATDTLTTSKTGNATAFSIGAKDNMSGTATLNNVRLLATRDTVYTGKTSADTAVVLNNCTIYGFQDVICGAGDATLTGCTWNVNSGNNARFFAPMADSVYKATNLTVSNSKKGKTAKSTFARAWGDGTSTVIIDGYTDSGSNIIADGTTISGTNTSIYGFETKPVTGSADIKTMLWIARKDDSEVFNTTLATVDDEANVFESATLEEDGSAYRIIGKIKSSIIDNITKVGFVLHGATDGQVILADDTAYIDGDDYYSVFFVDGNAANLEVTINPYVEYEGYAIECHGADGKSYSCTFETAATSAE